MHPKWECRNSSFPRLKEMATEMNSRCIPALVAGSLLGFSLLTGGIATAAVNGAAASHGPLHTQSADQVRKHKAHNKKHHKRHDSGTSTSSGENSTGSGGTGSSGGARSTGGTGSSGSSGSSSDSGASGGTGSSGSPDDPVSGLLGSLTGSGPSDHTAPRL
ncbi:MAG TPA: hypothetical protein VHV82_05665 [Sporichthyaceae bacterium]|nr:hypothetical protein [Sporichthyaceae bacterium]